MKRRYKFGLLAVILLFLAGMAITPYITSFPPASNNSDDDSDLPEIQARDLDDKE